MDITVIVFSILVSVICILMSVVQYYYLLFKETTNVKIFDPVFKDFIITDLSAYYAVDYAKNAIKDDSTYKHNNRNYKHVSRETEVEHCIKAAVAYKLSGKNEKALKLFEHAAAIAPDNPDVLNRYGEYLEKVHKDVISADELYFKALSFSPEHEGALSNRERTAHMVDQLDLRMFKVLDDKRSLLQEEVALDFDFEAKKRIYYLHIYHSASIEGNTMTVEQLQYVLETGRVVKGKTVVEHNEVIGLETALHYVKILITKSTITLADILEIHDRVMGSADHRNAGVLRTQQVFVGSYIPPPPEDLPKLMDDYVEWLNSDEAIQMHPVRCAALAHYKLVDIHPFTDGNGRTSRLLMNLILMRSRFPPVIISRLDRQKYYDYLTLANKGDVRPFIRFIAYSTDETLNTYLGRDKLLTHELEGISTIEINNRSV